MNILILSLPQGFYIIYYIYSAEMDLSLQISIQHITLSLYYNAVVIL